MKVGLFFLVVIVLSTNMSFAQINDDEIIEDEQIDNTVIKNNRKNNKIRQKKKVLKVDNIFIGTTFSFSISNSMYLDISPYGGYLFGKFLGVGIGGTYIYFADLIINQSDNIYGGRLFVNLRPFSELRGLNGLYAHVEGEYLNRTYAYSGGKPLRKFVPAVNVGLGYNTAFDKGFAFTAELLLNTLWFSRRNQGLINVYNLPWQYRVGIYYAF
ncbi:MAG: hypothetical protein MK207_16080 [Saprospiraceae bacterium]|nr:hypothetical protein [Saprospiraceae bacterium]